MSTTPSLITFEEFEQLPDPESGKRELLDGEIIEMPPPDPDHSDIAHRILFSLLRQIDDEMRVRGDRTGYLMGESWLEPDVSVQWPDQRRTSKYFIGAPMIAIEILSPRENTDDKVTTYLDNGAAEVWVLDRKHKRMTVCVRRGDEVIRRVEYGEYRSETTGVLISLPRIFGVKP